MIVASISKNILSTMSAPHSTISLLFKSTTQINKNPSRFGVITLKELGLGTHLNSHTFKEKPSPTIHLESLSITQKAL